MRKTNAALAAAAAAVLATGAGWSAASASPASQAASGTEHFYLMTTQPSASKYTVIASGVFTGGRYRHLRQHGRQGQAARRHLQDHHSGQIHIVVQKVNSKTCLAQFKGTASFTIGSGTGAYKGISGSGKATVAALEIAKRNAKGQCNPNATPVVNEQTITATAHVKL